MRSQRLHRFGFALFLCGGCTSVPQRDASVVPDTATVIDQDTMAENDVQTTPDVMQPCPPGRTRCGNECVDLRTSSMNCGRCGVACSSGGMPTNCMDGRCLANCTPPLADCDRDPQNGCETNLLTSNMSCGRCGARCPAGQTCTNGSCAGCPPPSSACNGMCISLSTDINNCGGCGQRCPPLPPGVVGPVTCQPSGQDGRDPGFCRAGDDFCSQSRGDCNGFSGDGYETDLRSSRDHCGQCGRRCPIATPMCCHGACQSAGMACNAC
jgi:hypothetical protein